MYKTQKYEKKATLNRKEGIAEAIRRVTMEILEENELSEENVVTVNTDFDNKKKLLITRVEYQIAEMYGNSLAEDVTRKQIQDALENLGYSKKDIRDIEYRNLSKTHYEKVWIVTLYDERAAKEVEQTMKMSATNLMNRVEREIGLVVYFNFVSE